MNYIKCLYQLIASSLLCTIIIAAKELTVSVVIPCVPKHVPHLRNLITLYAQQTIRPLEVIIALSEADKACPHVLRTIDGNDIQWPFKVTVLRSNTAMFAGTNRNRGVAHAQGDIIMFQDADDIPHPQRIEIVKYFFETHDIVHLLHFYISPYKNWFPASCKNPQKFIPYIKEAIVSQAFEWNHFANWEREKLYIIYGTPCLLRSACQQLPWPEDLRREEDMEYHRQALQLFPGKILVIHATLLLYRYEFSTSKSGTA